MDTQHLHFDRSPEPAKVKMNCPKFTRCARSRRVSPCGHRFHFLRGQRSPPALPLPSSSMTKSPINGVFNVTDSAIARCTHIKIQVQIMAVPLPLVFSFNTNVRSLTIVAFSVMSTFIQVKVIIELTSLPPMFHRNRTEQLVYKSGKSQSPQHSLNRWTIL